MKSLALCQISVILQHLAALPSWACLLLTKVFLLSHFPFSLSPVPSVISPYCPATCSPGLDYTYCRCAHESVCATMRWESLYGLAQSRQGVWQFTVLNCSCPVSANQPAKPMGILLVFPDVLFRFLIQCKNSRDHSQDYAALPWVLLDGIGKKQTIVKQVWL